MSKLQERIVELVEQGLSIAKIRAHLTIDDYPAKDISIALKEAGVSAKKRSFASDFYDYLVEASRTEAEAEAYILDPIHGGKADDDGKTNIQRHLSHYQAIADLTRRIHAANKVETEGE